MYQSQIDYRILGYIITLGFFIYKIFEFFKFCTIHIYVSYISTTTKYIRTMDKRKETLSFFIYMWNRFDKYEAHEVFNEGGTIPWEYSIGEHIYEIWMDNNKDIEEFVKKIDENCLGKLVERACHLYCGRTERFEFFE